MIVNKVWGWEDHLVTTYLYTLKRMIVAPGYQSSLHYHQEKDETFVVVAGKLVLELEEVATADRGGYTSTLVLEAGEQCRVIPGVAHRFWAGDDRACIFLEVSTYDDPDDNYRIVPSGPLDEA